ncbi:MAG: hypothetical protein PVI23_05745 [Maricaulaceae bacterium]
MEQVAEGKALLKGYKIGAFTGTVNTTESRVEEETTGSVSGGQGITVGGTGASAPVSGRIETKITRFQNIMIDGEDGQAHPIELKNFQVPCSPGQKLTVFQLMGGGDEGPVIHIYNHDSRRHYKNDKALNWAMFPFLILFAVLAVVVFFVWNWASGSSDDGFVTLAKTFIASAFIGLVIYGIAHIFAMIRAGGVRGNPEFKKRLSELSGG